LRKLIPTTFLGRKRMISFNNGGKTENRLDECGFFEGMEVNKDSVASLKS